MRELIPIRWLIACINSPPQTSCNACSLLGYQWPALRARTEAGKALVRKRIQDLVRQIKRAKNLTLLECASPYMSLRHKAAFAGDLSSFTFTGKYHPKLEIDTGAESRTSSNKNSVY